MNFMKFDDDIKHGDKSVLGIALRILYEQIKNHKYHEIPFGTEGCEYWGERGYHII